MRLPSFVSCFPVSCAQCLKDFVLCISLGFSVISSGRVNPVLTASSCCWCSSIGLTLFELKKLKKKIVVDVYRERKER